MREHFQVLAEALPRLACDDEVLLLNADGEQSDFLRFNRARVRQAGQAAQLRFNLCLIRDGRQAQAGFDSGRDAAQDLAQLQHLLQRLREHCAALPPDPYLSYATEVHCSESLSGNRLPEAGQLAAEIAGEARDLDLVGILASGDQVRGFANSLGQNNWHQRASFNFDFSCYVGDDRAVKSGLAGDQWRAQDWRDHLDGVRTQLAHLRRPRKPLQPGDYRVYLAPAALAELFGLLSWGGFGLKSLRTADSPLLSLAEGEQRLHASVQLVEDRASGLAPAFSDRGFVLPARVELVRGGAHAGSLVDARSAREFGVPMNSAIEAPQSLAMAGGGLARDEVLAALDTGLYINNLWYCNYADRNRCRMTGMTRFASFWVAQGRIQAPAEIMRFDDSLYGMLGERLLGLTRETEWLVDPDTYGGRQLAAMRLPGALVDAMRFAL